MLNIIEDIMTPFQKVAILVIFHCQGRMSETSANIHIIQTGKFLKDALAHIWKEGPYLEDQK